MLPFSPAHARCVSSVSSWTSACASPRPCPTCRGDNVTFCGVIPNWRASWRAGGGYREGDPRAHRVAGLRGARAAGAGQRPDVRDHVPVLPAVQRDHLPEVRVAVPTGRWSSTSCTPCKYVVGGEDLRRRGWTGGGCWGVGGGGGGGDVWGKGKVGWRGGLTLAVWRILSFSQGAGFISRGGSDVISRGGIWSKGGGGISRGHWGGGGGVLGKGERGSQRGSVADSITFARYWLYF